MLVYDLGEKGLKLYTGAVWVLLSSISPPPPTPFINQLGADIDGEAANDSSGESVSLSSDGSRVAIGAPGNDGNDSGHVRIYNQ